LKDQKSQIRVTKYSSIWNPSKIIWKIVEKTLKNENILFFGNALEDFQTTVFAFKNYSFFKEASVLAWAGENYTTDKLTPENFLNFYKETYVLKKGTEYEDSYVVLNINNITVEKFILEGLTFKSSRTNITIKQEVKVLAEKNKFDSQLKKFAKMIMDFWHYFKLETYYENYRLVFKVNQAVFDKVLKSASVLEQKSEVSSNISIFNPIINFFKSEISLNLRIKDYNNVRYKINLINKTEKSFTVKLLNKIPNINRSRNGMLLFNEFEVG